MKSFLPDKVYNVLKWLALIAIPVIGEAYVRLANVWGLPYGQQINETALIITFVLGALIGVSTVQYNKSVSIDIAKIGEEVQNTFAESTANVGGEVENVQGENVSTDYME